MKVDFSKHALEQMQLRQISKVIVNKILKNPGQVIEEMDTEFISRLSLLRGKLFNPYLCKSS